ncbi:MAG: hypothetical protein GX896_03275 [Clostridiales bacterium]|nr:hypothetical protein [Clostridiales bacterium]
MRKIISSLTASLVLTSAIAGFGFRNQKSEDFGSFSFFPSFTSSPAIEFEKGEDDNDRIQVVEQEKKVVIKFKFLEWIESIF